MQNNYNNFGLWFLSMKFSSVRIFKSAYVCCVQLRYTFPRLMLLQEPLLIIAAFYLLFLLVIIYVRLDFAISKVLLPAQQYNNAHLTALCLGLPRWASTSKVKPIWIILKQETVSGSGISWTIYKSAPRSRQITTPASRHSVFCLYRLLYVFCGSHRQQNQWSLAADISERGRRNGTKFCR